MTATQARKQFGFEHMNDRSRRVEEALKHAQYIRQAIDKLARTKEHAVLRALGIDPNEGECTSSDESTDEDESEEFEPNKENDCSLHLRDNIPGTTELIKTSQFNVFEVIACLQSQCSASVSPIQVCNELLELLELNKLELEKREAEQLKISCEAFRVDDEINSCLRRRVADAINGDIVTDSESGDDPDVVSKASTPFDESVKSLIMKKRSSIKLHASRAKAIQVAKQNFLHRKVSRKTKGIVKEYPDIGEKIEQFVKSNNVGADQWRRTGVLTFDGNLKDAKRVTYRRIQQYLEETYGRSFSYGTVVQLCIARNRRRRSAARYQGLAQVTTRRARKGFQLRYNPDFHWSNAFYRGLEYIQMTDGTNIINVNRDDASGFRLDTLATHKQYGTPTLRGSEVLTTHTDYVNRYPSVLQTTSYNFTGTPTTVELCAGVVKATPLHSKNPAQHAADFEMLKSQEEFSAVLRTPDNDPKTILCVRGDGASDEGPAHDEVQFWWAREHLLSERLVTLVTARSSGSSFLNRVELQNGCLSRGHANLFIPSTLAGSCMESNTVNTEVLKQNLELAIQTYIKYVNDSPCGKTTIHLYEGVNSESFQSYREHLRVFLKGSKKSKLGLKQSHPDVYQHLSDVWSVRQRHLVPGYPSQYVYFLRCCLDSTCIHPLCQRLTGHDLNQYKWFPGGPSVCTIPMPVPDPARPWNGACSDCKQFCAGHYLKPMEALQTTGFSHPPSMVILQTSKAGVLTNGSDIEDVARQVLLPKEEVNIWLTHLRTVSENRRKGAQKAAETRRSKKRSQSSKPSEQQEDLYYCGVCAEVYLEEADEEQDWIACDSCETWYHWKCACITKEPESYICSKCTH